MPVLWRYLLSQYFKVLLLCLFAFLAILLTTRLNEIARFASLDTDIKYLLLFALYQIPYILPITIPISCLISSMILFQRLSLTQELTALRSCGFALRSIISPILIVATYLTLINFYIVSELATHSHLASKQMINELRSINPLLLLQNSQLLKMKGIYSSIQSPITSEEVISDVIIATTNKSNDRLFLLIIKQLEVSSKKMTAYSTTSISSREPNQKNFYDHLLIENINKSTTPLDDISVFYKKEGWRLNEDHLKMPLLLVRTHELIFSLKEANDLGKSQEEIQTLKFELQECFTEIFRRLSLALAAFTFSLMGTAFGISIGRQRSKKSLIFVVGLAALFLCSFFLAKGLNQHLILSTLLYTVPHLLIIITSIWWLKQVTKGIE